MIEVCKRGACERGVWGKVVWERDVWACAVPQNPRVVKLRRFSGEALEYAYKRAGF